MNEKFEFISLPELKRRLEAEALAREKIVDQPVPVSGQHAQSLPVSTTTAPPTNPQFE